MDAGPSHSQEGPSDPGGRSRSKRNAKCDIGRNVPVFMNDLALNIIGSSQQAVSKKKGSARELSRVQPVLEIPEQPGDTCADRLKEQLNKLRNCGTFGERTLANREFFWKEEQSILHIAVKFLDDPEVVEDIVELCPELLIKSRTGSEYDGQTALHVAVCRRRPDLAKVLLEKARERRMDQWLVRQEATGSRFQFTVMMGGLPLIVAALCCDEKSHLVEAQKLVDLLLEHGAAIYDTNSCGDNVFHTIIRYSDIYPKKTQLLLAMCKYLDSKLTGRAPEEIQDLDHEPLTANDRQSVWQQVNNEGFTPLHLAALKGQAELFDFILNLDGAYCRTFGSEGLFDIHFYDITEIDSEALKKFNRTQEKNAKEFPRLLHPFKKKDMQVPSDCLINSRKCHCRASSVLDCILMVNFKQARHLVSTPIIKAVIRKKWNEYKTIYYCWTVLYVLYTIFLSAMSYYKVQGVVSQRRDGVKEGLVHAMAVLNFLYGLVVFGTEIFRLCYLCKSWHVKKIHHNGLYRFTLLCLAVSLMVDSIWFWVAPYTLYSNVALTVALPLQYGFLTFFMRGFHKFSFFTVLLQKIIIGDLFRFGLMILFVLISFSLAMHLTFLPLDPPVEGYEDYHKTLLAMFKLMIGLEDMQSLELSAIPDLSRTIFVVFVVLTYVLMLNALIAMMSETCALVKGDRKLQWELQRLAVILFIESSLLPRHRKLCGESKEVKRFDHRRNRTMTEDHYYLEYTTLQSGNPLTNPGLTEPSQQQHVSPTQQFNKALSKIMKRQQAKKKGTKRQPPDVKVAPTRMEVHTYSS